MKTATRVGALSGFALLALTVATCTVNDIAPTIDAATDGEPGVDASSDAGGATDASDSSFPAAAADAGIVDAGHGFATISGFDYNVCALMHDGRVTCWGDNANKILGFDTDAAVVYSPQYVPGITTAIQLATGSGGPCALLADGTLRCWGAYVGGLNNLPSQTVLAADGGPLDNVAQVSEGNSSVLARLTNGHAVAFGDNQGGTLSNGNTMNNPVPAEMLSGVSTSFTNVINLSDGQLGVSCLVLMDGTVHCAGAASRGDGIAVQGAISFADEALFPDSGPLTGVANIACGYQHCCAVQKNQLTVNCFGSNLLGERGTMNAQGFAWVDSPVTGLTGKVLSIAAGYFTSCAVIDNGTVQCWGANDWGQVGNGTMGGGVYTATTVAGLPSSPPVSVMTGGHSQACAVLADGTAWCWGNGLYGLLGDGQGKSSLKPVQVLAPM